MNAGVFDLFKVGIGPSSSHTVGPMRAARRFAEALADDGLLARTATVRAELFGSLALTGRGHGTPKAVLLGLEGEAPEGVDPDTIEPRLDRIRTSGRLRLLGRHEIAFDEGDDLVLHRRRRLPFHTNGMRFSAHDDRGVELIARTSYSIGGGFVVDGEEDAVAAAAVRQRRGAARPGLPHRPGHQRRHAREREGAPPGGRDPCAAAARLGRHARVRRARLHERGGAARRPARTAPGPCPTARPRGASGRQRPAGGMDWVTLYALAVNEENAAGGRVVTAPTNGAAGIVPAVLHYYRRFVTGADDDGTVRFLLAAGAIGALCKRNASISGAEVGCQGEVGSACAMAAAGLAEALGGTPEQVENAAEIGMEHNLGLTCDPVGGLVQIPCIERNALASVKAISAARIALHGDGRHHVSLDTVIKTMRDTGADMKDKYKETARGGLAVNVVAC